MVRLGILMLFLGIFSSIGLNAQVEKKISKAYQEFEKDSQLSHAIISLYVIDARTGQVVYDKNSQLGLAGASTQKIITAATAFELLGKDFRYETNFSKAGNIVYVQGSGDPTLGAERYANSRDTAIFRELIEASKKAGLGTIDLRVMVDPADRLVPRGWINEDEGNYYGAATHRFNWKENSYKLVFIPGRKKGDPAAIDSSQTLYSSSIINNCLTGAEGSGDNAYIYFLPMSEQLLVKGTVPAGVPRFTIRGADPYPESTFVNSFKSFAGNFYKPSALNSEMPAQLFFTHRSPSLDSISYWFLRESINLYGEALLNSIGLAGTGMAFPDSGIAVLQNFWKEKGLHEEEINIYDGSGLSPLNRVTTHAQVEILKFARDREWFPFYLAGFKDTNGMKMKSGTINNVKAYCGYHKSKEGKEYVFSFLVNNYNGRSSSLVNKMFRVLDELK